MTTYISSPKSSPLAASISLVSASLAVGALALSLIAAGSAVAQEAPASVVTVSTAGIDASTPDGSRRLAQRIEGAARKACGNVVVHSPLDPRAASDCRKDATNAAMAQVAQPSQVASR
jgi:UrcA family protein